MSQRDWRMATNCREIVRRTAQRYGRMLRVTCPLVARWLRFVATAGIVAESIRYDPIHVQSH
jgi:hypothetical protein